MNTKEIVLTAIMAHNYHDERPFYITEDKEIFRYRRDLHGKRALTFSCNELASLPAEEIDLELEDYFFLNA